MFEKRNIFLIGPMGAGKSTIGRQLARELNMKFYDSDYEIEKRTGVDINWVFDVEGESGFRIREEKVINELTQLNKIVLATGGGSVLSKNTRNFLSSRGVIIYLKVEIEKQIIRTKRDQHRPLLNTHEPIGMILKKLADIRNPLYESIADITINTNEKNAKSIVYYIINTLRNSR